MNLFVKILITSFSLIFYISNANAALMQDPSKIPVDVFAKQPTISNLKLSPNGDAIAMRMIQDNQPVAVIQNLDGSNRQFIGPRPRYEMASFYWANNDDLLILYRHDKSTGVKSMRFAVSKLYSFNRKKGKFKELFIPDARYLGMRSNRIPWGQNNFISWLPDDPDHIMMSARNGNEKFPPVFKLNIHTGGRETVQSGKRFIYNWKADRYDNIRLGYGVDEDKGDEIVIYKNNAGEWVNVSRDLGIGWHDEKYRVFYFDRNSDALIVSAISKYGTKGLYKYDLEKQEIIETIAENEKYDVNYRLTDSFTMETVGHGYYADTFQPTYTDPIYKSAYKQVNNILRGTDIEISMKAQTNSRFLVYVNSERLPSTYFLYDHDSNQIQPIVQTRPEINDRIMSPYLPVKYAARDGQEIHGYLTVPVGKPAKNLPVIIWPHGGPQSRTIKDFSPFVQFFASRGYAVFQPNFRGSTGYGQDFNLAMRGEWGGKMQNDVTDGTNWLIEQGIADPDRICIGGISYGGYAAAMGVIMEKDLYKCAISINGILDINTLIKTETAFSKDFRKAKYIEINGFPDVDSKSISPKHLVDQIQVPMLLISAKNDLTVNWENARDMHRAMKKNGKESVYISLDEGRHSMVTLKSRKTAMEAMEKFLAKHIGD